MKQAGQIVLVPFPFTDLSGAKPRPVLMLRKASVQFDDWLVCMVSSQLRQIDSKIDEMLSPGDADFTTAGLKVPSVLRLSRLRLDGYCSWDGWGRLVMGGCNEFVNGSPRGLRKRANE